MPGRHGYGWVTQAVPEPPRIEVISKRAQAPVPCRLREDGAVMVPAAATRFAACGYRIRAPDPKRYFPMHTVFDFASASALSLGSIEIQKDHGQQRAAPGHLRHPLLQSIRKQP